MFRKLTLGLLLATSTMITASAEEAVIDYPADTVRIYVPSSAGGGTDTNARIFAKFFDDYTDAEVAIVNQTSGGGVVAAQSVVTAKSDGSELLLFHAALHAASQSGAWPYSYKDFTALATTAAFDDVVIARPDAPFDTLAELVEYAKAKPQELRFGVTASGTTQIKGRAISEATGGNLRVVDSGTESDRITALLGKQVDITVAGVRNSGQYVEAGKVKVLGVLNKNPSPFQPSWPTAASQGIDVSFPLVFTIYGPKNLDAEVVAALDLVIEKLKSDKAAQQKFLDSAQAPDFRNSVETTEFLSTEAAFVASFSQ